MNQVVKENMIEMLRMVLTSGNVEAYTTVAHIFELEYQMMKKEKQNA